MALEMITIKIHRNNLQHFWFHSYRMSKSLKIFLITRTTSGSIPFVQENQSLPPAILLVPCVMLKKTDLTHMQYFWFHVYCSVPENQPKTCSTFFSPENLTFAHVVHWRSNAISNQSILSLPTDTTVHN
jgi:hypothetical protein